MNRKIVSIALPVMVQNMAFYIMTFTDTAFIGHYKIEGLSAINNAMIPFFMPFSFFIALSQGTTIFIAQSIGAKDHTKAGKIAETSFFYNQLISIGYFLFWFFAGKQVLVLMGATGEILDMGARYVQVLSFVYITAGMNLTSAALFQGIGKTMPIMVNTIVRSLLNVVLDYMLIFGKFGMPELGITGAALATVISATVTNIALTATSLKNGEIPILLKGILKPAKGVYNKVFTFGFQAGVEFMLFTGAQVVLIRMLNITDPMSAGFYGILNILINLSVNIYLGIGVAATTLVGRATGAKEHKLALQIGNRCVLYSLIVCSLIGVLFAIFPHNIANLFSSDTSVIEKITPMFTLLILITFPKSVNIVTGNSIRGTGDARWMLMTQTAGTITVISLSAYLIFRQEMGLTGVMLANFFDEFWRSIVNYIRFVYAGNKKLPQIDDSEKQVPIIPVPVLATVTVLKHQAINGVSIQDREKSVENA